MDKIDLKSLEEELAKLTPQICDIYHNYLQKTHPQLKG